MELVGAQHMEEVERRSLRRVNDKGRNTQSLFRTPPLMHASIVQALVRVPVHCSAGRLTPQPAG